MSTRFLPQAPHSQLLPESYPLHQNESLMIVSLLNLALYPPQGITSAGGYRAGV